jgi:hypothetical protein
MKKYNYKILLLTFGVYLIIISLFWYTLAKRFVSMKNFFYANFIQGPQESIPVNDLAVLDKDLYEEPDKSLGNELMTAVKPAAEETKNLKTVNSDTHIDFVTTLNKINLDYQIGFSLAGRYVCPTEQPAFTLGLIPFIRFKPDIKLFSDSLQKQCSLINSTEFSLYSLDLLPDVFSETLYDREIKIGPKLNFNPTEKMCLNFKPSPVVHHLFIENNKIDEKNAVKKSFKDNSENNISLICLNATNVDHDAAKLIKSCLLTEMTKIENITISEQTRLYSDFNELINDFGYIEECVDASIIVLTKIKYTDQQYCVSIKVLDVNNDDYVFSTVKQFSQLDDAVESARSLSVELANEFKYNLKQS